MSKPTILYFIRAEADLERISSIAIPGKAFANQYFTYYGDIDLLFDKGIRNKFQKELLRLNDFEIIDIITIAVWKILQVAHKIEHGIYLCQLLLRLQKNY